MDSFSKNESRGSMVSKETDHKHCWHTGSGIDQGIYGTNDGFTVTHFMCCHCGQTKTECREWKPSEPAQEEKHGKHSWLERRLPYEA